MSKHQYLHHELRNLMEHLSDKFQRQSAGPQSHITTYTTRNKSPIHCQFTQLLPNTPSTSGNKLQQQAFLRPAVFPVKGRRGKFSEVTPEGEKKFMKTSATPKIPPNTPFPAGFLFQRANNSEPIFKKKSRAREDEEQWVTLLQNKRTL